MECVRRLLGAFKRDGTPAKARQPSAFANFVKERFSKLKTARPTASHKELMTALGVEWRARNLISEGSQAESERTSQQESEEDILCSGLVRVLSLE